MSAPADSDRLLQQLSEQARRLEKSLARDEAELRSIASAEGAELIHQAVEAVRALARNAERALPVPRPPANADET